MDRAQEEMGSFPATLRRLRRAQNLTQQALATRAGVDRSYVSRLERGERGNPSQDVLVALARALDIPVDAFFLSATPPETRAEEPGDAELELLFASVRRLPEAQRRCVKQLLRAVLELAHCPAIGP